jgi:hypothetical protein
MGISNQHMRTPARTCTPDSPVSARLRTRSDPDVSPGWHRLLYLKGFTLTACSANREQTCNSHINRATLGVDFPLDERVANAFYEEQRLKYQDALATKLAKEAKEAEREREKKAARDYYKNLFGRRLSQRRALRARRNTSRDDAELDAELDPPRAPANGTRRELYINADGVFDLDAMIRWTAAHDEWLKVTDRYWGLGREGVALRLDLIRQQIKPEYITTVINSGVAEPTPAGYRTGLDALMTARCSDFIKRVYPNEERVHCCKDAPEGQSCNPEITYQSRPECNQRPLELANTNEETMGEEFLVRLAGLSPPPKPPPSPQPPPPPSPPAPPPPPAPPVAITVDMGKDMALIAQRQFCDSVRTQATSTPHTHTHTRARAHTHTHAPAHQTPFPIPLVAASMRRSTS